ncbi:sodium- and chloride-dependent GABA transporter 2-like [Styela clava]
MDDLKDKKEVQVQKQTYKNNFDYIFNLLGVMIGFSNVWRFPYICYKNGGGSFLFAYLIFAIFMILPLILIESALGQYTGRSAVKVWKIIPLISGMGFASPIIMFLCNVYYPVLLTWTLRWIVASVTENLSWTRCDNTWNTNSCIPLFIENEVNITGSKNRTDLYINSTTVQSSVEEFWNNRILGMTDEIENLGEMKYDLLICHAVIWILAYFAVWKGIQWTSKIVYFTVSLPFAMLIVVFVRGVTLDGAQDGIDLYLSPNITKLTDVEVWRDAADQILFSVGVCAGGIATLGQYNKFNHNFLRDSIFLIVANAVISFLAGFATFSILGFLAYSKNTTVEEVANSGPGLVFVAYPTALSLLPLPQVWCALFFVMLLLLGFDSQFVYHETFIACMKDQFPRFFRIKWANEIWVGVAAAVLFILSLPMLTMGGIYVLNIFNSYAVTGWCLYFISLVEFIAIGWIYGVDRFCDKMKLMLGFDVSRILLKICWKFVGPALSTALIVYSLSSYRPLTFGRSYVYPAWADALGWMTALSSMLTIPIGAVYVLYRTEGATLWEKLRKSIQVRDCCREEIKNELNLKTSDSRDNDINNRCKESLL